MLYKCHIYQLLLHCLLLQLGMGSAMETLCGQAYGAQRYGMLGIYLQRSTLILMATGIPLLFIYIFSKPILILLGQKPAIASAAAVFVYGLIPQNFAYAANFSIQKFLQSQSIIKPSAYIAAATLVVHSFFTWLVVYKTRWGILGASLMLSFSWWIIVVAQFVYILSSEKCKKRWTGFSMLAFSGLWDFLKLSLASAVMLSFRMLVLSNPCADCRAAQKCWNGTGFSCHMVNEWFQYLNIGVELSL